MNKYQLKNKYFYKFNLISKKLFLFLKNLINYFLFQLLRVLFFRKSKRTNHNRILFINTEKFGDLILSFDFLYSFQKEKSFEERFLLIDENYSELFELTSLSYSVITYKKKKYKYNLFYRASLLKKLSSYNFDTVINISPERGSLNDELTILTQSNNKIGLKSLSPFYVSIFNNVYKNYYSLFINSESINEYEILKSCLKYYNLDVKEYYDEKWERKIQNKIVIAPSASEPKRNWRPENFRRLLEQLSKSYFVILVGTSKQKKLLQDLAEGLSNAKIEVNKSYHELFDLISSAILFVGLDSGLTHLALQLSRPLVSIIGGGKHGIFFPYKESSRTYFAAHKMDCFKCFWNCKYKNPYCIDKVSYDEILNACNERLSEYSR